MYVPKRGRVKPTLIDRSIGSDLTQRAALDCRGVGGRVSSGAVRRDQILKP